MAPNFMGFMEDVCDWVLDHIVEPVTNWLSGILSNLFKYIFDELLGNIVIPVLKAVMDYVGTAILDVLYSVFYYIYASCLQLIDFLQKAFDVLIGIQNVSYVDALNQKTEAPLINAILMSDNIRTIVYGITLIAFALSMIFAIYAVIRSITDFDFENKRPVFMVLRSLFKTMINFLMVPLLIFVLLSLSSVILTSTISAFPENSLSIGNTLLAITSFGAAKNFTGTPSLDVEPWASIASGKISYWTFQTSELFHISKVDYLVGYICVIFLLVILGMCLFTFIKRIYEILLLYIVSPYFVSTMVLDDGEKFSRWRTVMVAKVFTGFGSAIAMRLFLLLVPMIMSDRISFFSDNLAGSAGNYLVKLIFIVGGAYAVYKSSSMITSIIDANVGADERMSNMMGMGAMMGAASVGLSGAKKLGAKASAAYKKLGSGSKRGASLPKSNKFSAAHPPIDTGIKINGEKGATKKQSKELSKAFENLDIDVDRDYTSAGRKDNELVSTSGEFGADRKDMQERNERAMQNLNIDVDRDYTSGGRKDNELVSTSGEFGADRKDMQERNERAMKNLDIDIDRDYTRKDTNENDSLSNSEDFDDDLNDMQDNDEDESTSKDNEPTTKVSDDHENETTSKYDPKDMQMVLAGSVTPKTDGGNSGSTGTPKTGGGNNAPTGKPKTGGGNNGSTGNPTSDGGNSGSTGTPKTGGGNNAPTGNPTSGGGNNTSTGNPTSGGGNNGSTGNPSSGGRGNVPTGGNNSSKFSKITGPTFSEDPQKNLNMFDFSSGIDRINMGKGEFKLPKGMTVLPKFVKKSDAPQEFARLKEQGSGYSQYYSQIENGSEVYCHASSNPDMSTNSIMNTNGVCYDTPDDFVVIPEIMPISTAKEQCEELSKGEVMTDYYMGMKAQLGGKNAIAKATSKTFTTLRREGISGVYVKPNADGRGVSSVTSVKRNQPSQYGRPPQYSTPQRNGAPPQRSTPRPQDKSSQYGTPRKD